MSKRKPAKVSKRGSILKKSKAKRAVQATAKAKKESCLPLGTGGSTEPQPKPPLKSPTPVSDLGPSASPHTNPTTTVREEPQQTIADSGTQKWFGFSSAMANVSAKPAPLLQS